MNLSSLLRHRFDDRTINIFLASGRAYWCKVFNCTDMQLRNAVAVAGNRAAAAEKYAKGLAYYPLVQ